MKPIFRVSIFLVIILMLGIALVPKNTDASIIRYYIILDPDDSLDVDTGTPGNPSTRDIWRTTSGDSIDKLKAENGAVFAYVGNVGDVDYIYKAICDASQYTFDITNIPVSSITFGDMYIIRTSEGHYAKISLYVSGGQVAMPVLYQNDGSTTLCEYQFTIKPGEVNVAPSSDFTIDIWIQDLPAPMQDFFFVVYWDPTYMTYVSHETYDHGWIYEAGYPDISDNRFAISMEAGDALAVDYDSLWFTITFHCEQEGTSDIELWSMDTITLVDGTWIVPTTFIVTVNQRLRSVGGIITPTNTLLILWPYLTLVGLVTAVTTAAVVMKKRRKA